MAEDKNPSQRRTLCAWCIASLPPSVKFTTLMMNGKPVVFRTECEGCHDVLSVASIQIIEEGSR